jgi:membrane associated rhomboid family serine protease
VENIYTENNTASRTMRSQMSYQKALSQYRSVHGLSRISWVTWGVVTGTIIIWCVTAYQFALATGAHNAHDIIAAVMNNAINIQDKDNNALSSVLIAFGAKDNDLILQGQYWRFVTPIFLHANLLHVGLNMLNLAVLGVFLERLVGHMRFLLIYMTTGIVSIIASFYFMPQEISVGASGAIFGLVGAYSVFVLMHRRAFRKGGIPALLWLIIVIAGNLSIGFFVPNVDNYAHLGGLLSGCLLGWWFTPLYTLTQDTTLIDKHSLSRRWPLALLTIASTLTLAIIARLFIGG